MFEFQKEAAPYSTQTTDEDEILNPEQTYVEKMMISLVIQQL